MNETQDTTRECARVRARLDDWLDGDADAADAGRIAAHLPTCAACRAEREFRARLRARVARAVAAAPPDRLRARLQAAVRAEAPGLPTRHSVQIREERCGATRRWECRETISGAAAAVAAPAPTPPPVNDAPTRTVRRVVTTTRVRQKVGGTL